MELFDWYAVFATSLCGFYTAARCLDWRRRVVDRNRLRERELETGSLLARTDEHLQRAVLLVDQAQAERAAIREERLALTQLRFQVECLLGSIHPASLTEAAVAIALWASHERLGRRVDADLCGVVAEELTALLSRPESKPAAKRVEATRVIDV